MQDALLALVVLGAQLAPFVRDGDERAEVYAWQGYLVVALSVVPILWRRRAPLICLIACSLVLASYDLWGPLPSQPIWYASLVLTYTMAARSAKWVRWVGLVGNIVGGLLLVGSFDTAMRGVVLYVTAYAMGRVTAMRLEHAAALEDRALRLERERELEAERAAAEERARIARDMHDVLAHAVSLMVVQAEAGPVVVRSAPDRAEAAFDAIAKAGRDAMAQLRRMLGVLKEGEGARSPQPTLARLPELAEEVSRSGLAVELHQEGDPRPVPPEVEIAAYRIVQEALTNVVKHAAATRADIRLIWQDADLLLTVTDDGRGRAARGAAWSGGNGLIGIRERAAATGGSASAGPRAGTPGFQVSVRLPLSVPVTA
ncbi:sensor histidine kinase [Bailinhaonella thermotolerans]|uniref:sensor histidine kinase n=1 Tax=Bailinhaonella thermotolerans TaxID=1070861 RepID=UPI001F5BC9DF|nr:histidine kinase [Bailinhaonella thermotolerans]